METDNETRPLLHDFESETWRSKARKRCLRIPSEVAITGIILGLFFVVVTLLIVLENMEETKESDISLDKTLLASPFKYNKKAEDKSWQDKKNIMRPKETQNDLKWDKVNKGWKKFPDISGKIDSRLNDRVKKNWNDNADSLGLPAVIDDYGKEVEDSLEELYSLELKDPDLLKALYEDTTDIESLLQSPKIKWNEVDSEWKKLSKEGWKDKEIGDALFKALIERREELKKNENVLQSPVNLNQFWDQINDSWKKNIEEGNKEIEYQKLKGKKEVERQKNINDEWKNKMTPLQSPKATMKNTVRDDNGWKTLTRQGWKYKDIKNAIIEAWSEKEGLLQSPMKIPNLWGKANDFLKNIIQKGMDKQRAQKDINDEWANKFGGSMQSPKSSTNKENIIDKFLKKKPKYDPNEESTDKTGQEENEQSFNFEDFLENIVDTIAEYQKDREAKNFDKAGQGKENTDYSSANFEDFLNNIVESIKEHQKGNKEADKQKSINDEWKNRMNVLKTAKIPDQKWKKGDDHWKTLIEYERHSYYGKNDNTEPPSTRGDRLQHSMSLDNMKLEKIDNGWKKLSEQGWKDQDLKEAVYKAWKDGDKLLQSAIGHNNMKWKKVNDGWKKISNKS